MSERNQHFLVIGSCDTCAPKDCDCSIVGDAPTFRMSIECPGVTDDCMAYFECFKNHDIDGNLDAILEACDANDGAEIHGQWHRYIDGNLCTETNKCWVQQSDYVEAVYWAFDCSERPMKPGRYAITHGCPDFGSIEIEILDEVTA